VVGDKEMEADQVAVRLRNNENPGPMSLNAFTDLVKKDVESGV
jgi:threonyl-tRNA synthetase